MFTLFLVNHISLDGFLEVLYFGGYKLSRLSCLFIEVYFLSFGRHYHNLKQILKKPLFMLTIDQNMSVYIIGTCLFLNI